MMMMPKQLLDRWSSPEIHLHVVDVVVVKEGLIVMNNDEAQVVLMHIREHKSSSTLQPG